MENSDRMSVDVSRSLLEIAKTAALSVGDQLRVAFRTPMHKDFKKDAHDIVTVHDKASEQQIRSVILEQVPDSMILGEEGGSIGSGAVEWYVDPIDGTSNFSRGIPLWCVSIAAAVHGELVAGVVYNPVTEELFSADLTGSWLNGTSLASHASHDELGATLITNFPNARDVGFFGPEAKTAHTELLLSFQNVRSHGSGALGLAYVAAGWADATMGINTNPWDVSAGVLILRQAGGSYHGYRHGSRYRPGHLAPDYFAVGATDGDYDTLRLIVERLSELRKSGSAS